MSTTTERLKSDNQHFYTKLNELEHRLYRMEQALLIFSSLLTGEAKEKAATIQELEALKLTLGKYFQMMLTEKAPLNVPSA